MREEIRRGSLTVEAAVVLPLVFMIIFSVLMVSKVYSTQALIDQALTKVTYDVSNAGYILRDTKLLGLVNKMEADGEAGLESFEEIKNSTTDYINNVDEVPDMFDDLKSNLAILKTANSVSDVIDAIAAVKSNIDGAYFLIIDGFTLAQTYLDMLISPDTYKAGASVILASLTDDIKNYIGVLYVNYAMDKYFGVETPADGENLLKKLYLEGNITYLESKFYTTGDKIFGESAKEGMTDKKNLIKVTATYSMDIPFPMDFGLEFLNLENTVVMRGFTGEM